MPGEKQELNLGISGFQNKKNSNAQVFNLTHNFYVALFLINDYKIFSK